ncbi:MAG: MFS transporter [Verrucomicrobiota bacterium]|nr:MFS transporter [Verrucomicrobiota bacterium]MCC6822584.1 MFS transporter [Limisphaerales bacterium]
MNDHNATTGGPPKVASGLAGGPSPTRDRRYEFWRWRIFGITWLAYAGFYLTRKAFSVAKNELKKPEVMGMTKADMSWIDGANSVAYALGQFIWGPLGDKFGPRAIVLVGMLASVTTALAMGSSSTVLLMGVLFALQGLCQSSGWAPLTKNVGEFFSRRERGSVMGFWCTNYALGGFVASTLAAWAAQKFGWRYAFFVPAGGLFGIWILFLLFQRNRPEDVGLPPIEQYHGEAEEVIDPAATPALEPEGSWKIVVEVMRNKMVWLLAGVYFLIKPTRYLMLFWSPVYINELLGTGTATSGFLGSLFDLAGPLGSLTGGLISDRLFKSKRVPVCVITLFILAVLMVTFRFLPATRLAVGAGMFAIGFLVFIPDTLISGAAAMDFGTKKGASTASGIINGFGSIGQIIGVTLPGWADKLVGQGHDIWNPIFLWLGVALALAGLLMVPQWNRVPPSVPAKS